MRPGQKCPGKQSTPKGSGAWESCFNEAGAEMPRKTPRLVDDVLAQGVASMRPGQKCPGKPRRACCSKPTRTRFNEAGAEMPRKTGVVPGEAAPPTPRFNEAGAEMPRKTRFREQTVADEQQLQ